MTLSPKQLQTLAAGQEHHRAGRLAEAERAYRAVLRRDPGHPLPLQLLAILAADTGRHRDAAAFASRALLREPGNAALHHRLAEAYRALGDHGRAHQAYLKAIALRADFLEAHVDCAHSAGEAAERAAQAGDDQEARRWRAVAGQQLTRVGELHTTVRSGARAETAFRHALELDPENAEAHWRYASLLGQMARFSEAETHYRRSIALRPGFAPAYSHLAVVVGLLGRKEEADTLYKRALELEPGESSAAYAVSSGRLVSLHYRSDLSAEEIFAEHRRWGNAQIARPHQTSAPFPNSPDPDRPLRIGYVSPDFRQHSVIHFLEPLLAHHDRSTIEVTCYAEVAEPDAVTQRFKSLARRWRPTVGVSDADLRKQIREDRIDVLVDLAGHTGSSRIAAFAVKPAPVTATWLGYPATTGLSTVDYRFTDERADPEGAAERLHTERLVRLPDGFLCYRPPAGTAQVQPSPALARDFVTFGSFNFPEKVTPQVVQVWAAILSEVPKSRLLLKGWHFGDAAIRQRYLDEFSAAGVPPDRIDLRPMIAGMVEHLRLYQEIDIALDPFPYNGTTTTCEALWMGVPVVTLVGDRHVARVGLSLLWQIGLTQLAAADRAAYVGIAGDLARDTDKLNRLRLELRERMRRSPLMDAPRFAKSFEAAIRTIWRTWCAEQARPGC